MRSDPRLKRIFNEYNRKWFGGKLPGSTVVRWARSKKDLKFECESKTVLACADNETIVMSPWMKGSTNLCRFTMLHEMVHVKLPPIAGHGPRFQKEMHRLARAGAFAKLW